MNPKLKNINVFSSPQCFLASFSSFFLFVIIIVAKIMGPPPVAVPQTSVFTQMMTLLWDKVMKCKTLQCTS